MRRQPSIWKYSMGTPESKRKSLRQALPVIKEPTSAQIRDYVREKVGAHFKLRHTARLEARRRRERKDASR